MRLDRYLQNHVTNAPPPLHRGGADIRAFAYFTQHINDYAGWHFTLNSIKDYNRLLPFDSEENQWALKRGRLKITWYDFLLPGNFVGAGLINWLSLEDF